MKRIVLFLATNIAVLVVLSVIINVFGLGNFLTAEGIDPVGLLVFSAVVGFAGSIISLLISKPMAKASTGARVIDGSEGTTEHWLVQTVEKLARQGDLAVYQHGGFWQSMDTYREMCLLNDMWASGQAPWRIWEPCRLSA